MSYFIGLDFGFMCIKSFIFSFPLSTGSSKTKSFFFFLLCPSCCNAKTLQHFEVMKSRRNETITITLIIVGVSIRCEIKEDRQVVYYTSTSLYYLYRISLTLCTYSSLTGALRGVFRISIKSFPL